MTLSLSDVAKECRKCSVVKPLEDFYRHPEMHDGHLNICKACKLIYQHQRVLDGFTQPIDWKRYHTSPKRKMDTSIKAKQWREKNPDGMRAHSAVSHAINNGKISRGVCEVCGEKGHAHHDDYNYPLIIRWLCPLHHARHHAGMP